MGKPDTGDYPHLPPLSSLTFLSPIPTTEPRSVAGLQHPCDSRKRLRGRQKGAPNTPEPGLEAAFGTPSPAEGRFDRKGAPFCLRAVMPTASRDHVFAHSSPLILLLALPPSHALALFFRVSFSSLPSPHPPLFPGFLPSLRFPLCMLYFPRVLGSLHRFCEVLSVPKRWCGGHVFQAQGLAPLHRCLPGWSRKQS